MASMVARGTAVTLNVFGDVTEDNGVRVAPGTTWIPVLELGTGPSVPTVLVFIDMVVTTAGASCAPIKDPPEAELAEDGSNAAVVIGTVVVVTGASWDELTDDPPETALAKGVGNAVVVRGAKMGVIGMDIKPVEPETDAASQVLASTTLRLLDFSTFLTSCSISWSFRMEIVFRIGGPGREALQNVQDCSVFRVRCSHSGHLQVSRDVCFQLLS